MVARSWDIDTRCPWTPLHPRSHTIYRPRAIPGAISVHKPSQSVTYLGLYHVDEYFVPPEITILQFMTIAPSPPSVFRCASGFPLGLGTPCAVAFSGGRARSRPIPSGVGVAMGQGSHEECAQRVPGVHPTGE